MMTLQTMARSVCVSIICFIIHPPDINAWILFIYTHPCLYACRSIGRSNRPDSSEGNQQEAITKLDEAYSIFKENFGAEHITIAACLADKALLLRLLRRYDEALKLNEEALKMFIKEAPGGVSPQVATTTQCIGTILADTGRLEEAKEKYEESLSLLRRVHGGRDHPDVATALNNVSDILQKQGRWDESYPFLEKVLKMRKRLFGDDHVEVAQVKLCVHLQSKCIHLQSSKYRGCSCRFQDRRTRIATRV